MKTVCELCPHHCALEEGQTGLCRARRNSGGKVVCANYGKVTSLALDPIEKKPLRQFCPGGKILSVGSYGCNLRCPFCQNSSISMADGEHAQSISVTPEALAEKAAELVPQGNLGLAYTYNEPLVGYEFVRDCAALIRARGLKNVVVTNGCICEEPLKDLLPLIDAVNMDLKGFTERFYRMVGGDLKTVMRAIELSAKSCHTEVTTLVIPGENDSEDEMDALSGWLASVDAEIPLHISRFFPCFQMTDRAPTAVETVYRLAEIARRHLKYVYEGNC
ncbi:AmmeMemoRadiSam system radical SAM enzyme [Caproiciproducens faecalis]|uniref:AmmeMemoRadiSam system radical SAM enzyme n=1 Tax=Caproiciproducens faecalis TaxID=2820301 RepID=A0ABS7DM02_9FIRM|nr:AmmeMemoRadiSam system radical SAM enzyme [Caproiciproducens faecalis]MBW7572307.1 AmmeMemoRadiSam system radical SAM enzyme [Caproiciproducens faecalis]